MNRECVGAVDVAVVICPRGELLTRSMKHFRETVSSVWVRYFKKNINIVPVLLLSKLSVNGFM